MKSPTKKEKKPAPRPKEQASEKSALTEFFKNPFFSSKVFEITLFCFIIGLAFLGGVLFLSADPPAISWSQDIATDPPQYTHYARNKILWESWEPFGPNRFVFFMKSFTTLFSYLVFSLFGVGRFQANLVAVLLNLLSLVFFFLALKRIFNKRMAFLSLFFVSTNYIFIMYARNPFLEISANFLLVLGFYFMVSSLKRELLLIPSGICFATGIFFGKIMAAFILPACLVVLLLWMFERYSSEDRSDDRPSGRKINLKPLLLFGSGFFVITIFWLFFSYLPAQKEVAGYLGEQALGLYGFPKALLSVSGFFSALFTFGEDLFYRMPVVFLLSLFGLLLFFYDRPSIKKLFRHRDNESKVKLFLILWFLVSFFLLMVLNYRPLRYQFYLIAPLCALSGLWLDSFLRSSGSKREARLGILFWVVFVVAAMFFINYTIITFCVLSQKPIELATSLIISFVTTLLFGFLFYWRVRSRTIIKRRSAVGGVHHTVHTGGRRFLIMLILLLMSLLVNVWQYKSWASSRMYSLNKSSVDLGNILNEEAVVSGPYGSGLVWDNKLKNIIHMFGVTKPDPQLFLTYPITHLALERGGNRDRAFQDYPQVMKNAKIVTTYWLRKIPVDIYRIAEWTSNPKTEKYRLSDFEKAKILMEKGDTNSAVALLEEFVSQHPQNISGYQTLAEIYYSLGKFDKSANSLEQAIKFNPTDFFIHQQVGLVYLALLNVTGEDNYRWKAIKEWERSLEIFPENAELAARLKKIKGY